MINSLLVTLKNNLLPNVGLQKWSLISSAFLNVGNSLLAEGYWDDTLALLVGG
jgi:hypothetical protein